MIFNLFKKKIKEEKKTAIDLMKEINNLNLEVNQENYIKITKILSCKHVKPYNAREFNFFEEEILLFFKNIFPFILIDESSLLLCLILQKLTDGRDDHFIDFIFKDEKKPFEIIENHKNVLYFLLIIPSKGLFYSKICKKIKRIYYSKEQEKYIDLIISLREKGLFKNDTVERVYLRREHKEKTIEEFETNLENYIKQKKTFNKLNNF